MLLQKIEYKRADSVREKEKQIAILEQIREEYDEKNILIDGFSREINDIDYILKSKSDNSEIDKTKLSAIKQDYINRSPKKLLEYRMNLKRRQDQVMFEITGLETEIIKIDNQIQQIETARKSAEVLMAKKREEMIRKSRAISGINSPKFLELFELSLDFAVNAEKNESEYKKYFEMVNATIGEAGSHENVILNPHSINLGGIVKNNDQAFNETLDDRLKNTTRFCEQNSVVARSIMNKYLGTNYS
ncbi:MAG: hypothetical protein QXG00_05630 [Candidatus Woesearchaeota archaeon]